MSQPFQENVPLAPLVTFRTGGSARYLVTVSNLTELQGALAEAKKRRWPLFILAGGSNLIVSSKGFNGLVIRVQFGGLKVDGTTLTAGAAAAMPELVDQSIEHGLAGLEWAGGLPGSFGGAIRGNAGAFGGEIKDVVELVTAVSHTGELKHWTNADCGFEYRGSIFKRTPRWVIILGRLKLRPGEKTALRQTADEHIKYRQEKHPLEFPNAGSAFKNVPVEKISAKVLEQWSSNIKTDPFPVVPAAKIIADAGLKGCRVGDAQISEKHTNYIVNLGAATGEDIVELIKKVRLAVREKYQVELEVEPELVGF